MEQGYFVEQFKDVFEHSPWIPRRAWGILRDTGRGYSPQESHRAMVEVVKSAEREEQLSLLKAHPQLAGKEAQAGSLTSHSTGEQSSARLDRLTPDEMKRITNLNREYLEKFGFPFIIAVRRYRKEEIFQEWERRLHHDRESEIAAALEQVYEIARIRLGIAE